MTETLNPLVSIILPTYNRAGLIMETIESICRQTYSNWELVIVDDGSDDNTAELISDLNDDRIHFVKAGRIGIGGKIKNIGITKAKGDLIAFIDSDDLWAETKLEKQVLALQQHSEAGFCLTGGYIFTRKGVPDYFFYKVKEGRRVDHLFDAIFQAEVTVYTQALVVKKECLATAGMFREEKSFSDLEFVVNLAAYYKGIILYEPLLFRRIHDANFITHTWEQSSREGIEIILENKKKLPASIASTALFKAYIQLGEKYLVHHNAGKALGCFFQAWKYKPLNIVPAKKIMKAGWYFVSGK